MPHVNVLKQIRVGKGWKLVSIPRNRHGGYDWRALPEGRYFIEWWERGKRKRQAAGATTADALEAARRRKHIMEGKALGMESEIALEEETKRAPLHLAVKRYLEVVEGLKKPNTLRKYKAVWRRPGRHQRWLRVPPYNPLIVRDQGRRAFNASFMQEFAGTPACRNPAFHAGHEAPHGIRVLDQRRGRYWRAELECRPARRRRHLYRRIPALRATVRVSAGQGADVVGWDVFSGAASAVCADRRHAVGKRAQRRAARSAKSAAAGPDVWPAATSSNALSAVPFDEQALARPAAICRARSGR